MEMKIFNQFEIIDEYVEKRRLNQAKDILLATGIDTGMGMQMNSSGWSYSPPNAVLRYNPSANKWSHQDPNDTLKYNGNLDSWGWAGPNDTLKYNPDNEF